MNGVAETDLSDLSVFGDVDISDSLKQWPVDLKVSLQSAILCQVHLDSVETRAICFHSVSR